MVFGQMPAACLAGLEFLDRSAAFLEKDAVAAVRAPDIHVDLDFLLAPCTLVGTCHADIRYFLLSSTVRSIARWAIFMVGVIGWYAPPANLYPHLRHSQMPVPLRATDSMSHFGQRCSACEIFSISFTRLRTNLPYRHPKRPELPVTFPFAFCVEVAIMDIHRSVFFYLSSELIYLIEDLDLSLAFRELVDEVVELALDPGRDPYYADP